MGPLNAQFCLLFNTKPRTSTLVAILYRFVTPTNSRPFRLPKPSMLEMEAYKLR